MIWAKRSAERNLDGALTAVERLSRVEHDVLLPEIARRALSHITNSHDECALSSNASTLKIFAIGILMTICPIIFPVVESARAK